MAGLARLRFPPASSNSATSRAKTVVVRFIEYSFRVRRSSLHVADGRVPDQARQDELASGVPVFRPIAFHDFGHIPGGRAQPI